MSMAVSNRKPSIELRTSTPINFNLPRRKSVFIYLILKSIQTRDELIANDIWLTVNRFIPFPTQTITQVTIMATTVFDIP